MAKIEDAGEVIPHAKKHLARKAVTKRPAQPSRLAELWPEPDWKELSRQGRYTPATLAVLASTYWSLGTAPLTESLFGIEAHEWPALYDGAVALVRRVFEEAHDETRAELISKARALAGISRLSGTRESMALAAAGRYGGRKLYPPFYLTRKVAWLCNSMADLGWPEDDSCLRTSIGVVGLGESPLPSEVAWRVITVKPRAMFLPGLPAMTRRDALIAAREAIQTQLAEDAATAGKRKAVTRRSTVDLDARVGPDYLGGWDISAEELLDTFRLRGIQFGESLTDKEKQRWLNEAFCALHDLARVINFEPEWLGLGGHGRPTLGLAFGARGHGGASAHFEPALWAINLTRESGHGAAAHEWAHAFDSHMVHSTFASGLTNFGVKDFMTNERYSAIPSRMTRRAAFDHFARLCDEIFQPSSPYYKHAMRIEALKGARKQYWASPIELWARSFEAFVEDELVSRGESSPWLVHGTLAKDQHDLSMSAYPLGEQRERLRGLWQAFFASLVPRSQATAQLQEAA